VYALSLHDALPICASEPRGHGRAEQDERSAQERADIRCEKVRAPIDCRRSSDLANPFVRRRDRWEDSEEREQQHDGDDTGRGADPLDGRTGLLHGILLGWMTRSTVDPSLDHVVCRLANIDVCRSADAI